MRVAFLWNGISGYHNACLKELASRPDIELFVCHEPASASAPYDEAQFAWMKKRVEWTRQSDLVSLLKELHEFKPHILIFASWNKPFYRKVAKSFAGKTWRVMGMDNCWRGTLKQWLGTLNAWYYVRPLADAVWLPGERQAVFARRLGFEQRVIIRGSLSCDQGPIAERYLQRVSDGKPLPRAFLYVGRFAPEKGLSTLVSAYTAYRKTSPNPWPLICCGAGPLQSTLQGHDGIRIEGFVQPMDMPAKLASAGCLILPSDFEPWALVIHEATSAGLPVIASEKVGAAVHLVQPNYNGFIFGCGDVEHLTGLMVHVSSMSDERLEAMSRASYALSQQFSPALWVNALFDAYAAASGNPSKE
jgi:glycosyltransferase involved in cell wall biosynthesis